MEVTSRRFWSCFVRNLSLIHISEPTRPERISYAVFNHLMEGLETRLDLDGSMNVTVSQRMRLERSNENNSVANFYAGMLCNSSEGKLQQRLLQLLPGVDASVVEEVLPELTVLAGRIDLAALGVQKLAAQRVVSVYMEDGSDPTLVLKIHFPRKIILKVYYGQNSSRSVYWSLPSNVSCEQDGKPCHQLNTALNQWLNCRSLKATAEFLLRACQTVEASLSLIHI